MTPEQIKQLKPDQIETILVKLKTGEEFAPGFIQYHDGLFYLTDKDKRGYKQIPKEVVESVQVRVKAEMK